MKEIESGGVVYSWLIGDVSITGKGRRIRLKEPTSFDEEMRSDNTLEDGDRIVTGRRSFIVVQDDTKDSSSL